MTLETDMKSLVEDIQASRDARGKALNDIRKDTHHIIGDAKSMLKDFAKEGEERAQDVKRIAREVKSFLKSSGENRKNDFEATMKTVRTSLEDVKKDSKHARKDARDLVSRYHDSRMSAQKHWASLSAGRKKAE